VTGDTRYAVILGEALVDLLEATTGTATVYQTAIGGGPLNVAVGVCRLGGDAHFVGTLSEDVWGDRIAAFLAETGVAAHGVRRVATPTTLALTTFAGPEPRFRFYGEPPSYGRLTAEDLDLPLLADATVLYAGSISLLVQPFLSAARRAWSVPGPLRVFDPNVRPTLLAGDAAVTGLRNLVEEFAATAHLVKLSSADIDVLYPGKSVPDVARHLRAAGAETVVVTCGPDGAWLDTGTQPVAIPAPEVNAVDATGAGDSVMAALISRLLQEGAPRGADEWRDNLTFALHVAGLVCERHGGAVAMPTRQELNQRWPAQQPAWTGHRPARAPTG
jgi:fructokinase